VWGQLTDATIKRVTAGLDAHALRDRYTQRVAAQEEFALNLKKKQLALKVWSRGQPGALIPGFRSCARPKPSPTAQRPGRLKIL
jgi:hypothetical protein